MEKINVNFDIPAEILSGLGKSFKIDSATIRNTSTGRYVCHIWESTPGSLSRVLGPVAPVAAPGMAGLAAATPFLGVAAVCAVGLAALVFGKVHSMEMEQRAAAARMDQRLSALYEELQEQRRQQEAQNEILREQGRTLQRIEAMLRTMSAGQEQILSDCEDLRHFNDLGLTEPVTIARQFFQFGDYEEARKKCVESLGTLHNFIMRTSCSDHAGNVSRLKNSVHTLALTLRFHCMAQVRIDPAFVPQVLPTYADRLSEIKGHLASGVSSGYSTESLPDRIPLEQLYELRRRKHLVPLVAIVQEGIDFCRSAQQWFKQAQELDADQLRAVEEQGYLCLPVEHS